MAIKKTGSKNLKIIAATSMTIFSLFVAFSGAFAWFVSARQLASGADTFEVSDIAGRFNKITFHELDSKTVGNTYEASTFKFNKTAVGTLTYDWSSRSFKEEGKVSVTLDNYDYLDHEKPLMMLIELKDEYDATDPISIKLETESLTQTFMGARDASSNPVKAINDASLIIDTGTITRDGKSVDVNYYGLSNVTKFHTVEFSKDEYDDTFNAGSTYDFTGLNNQKSFVSIDNANETSSFSTDVAPLIKTTDKVKYIAIVVDYYSDAVEYIYSTYLGDTTLEDTYDSYLYFKCDWYMEVL